MATDAALQVFDIPVGNFALEEESVLFNVICQPTGYLAEAMSREK